MSVLLRLAGQGTSGIILQDSNLVFWRVGVTNDGLVTTTVVPAGPATPTILSDSGTLYTLGVDTLGRLTTTVVGSGTSVASVPLFTATGTRWELMIVPASAGILETVLDGALLQDAASN